MLQIILIISFILLSISIILFYKANKIKIQKIDENNKVLQKLGLVKIEYRNNQAFITKQKQQIANLLKQKQIINNDLEKEKNNLNNHYKLLKQQTNKSFEQYCNTLDKCYGTKEKEFSLKIEQIKKQREQVENQLTQIKSVYQAATAARLREQEQQSKKMFYKLQISKKQISDITKLEDWKSELQDPSIVSKIIWSSYIIKPTTDLCNRVVGSSIVCGIYKITNQLTGEVYIGQSVNISDRFKQHIKCGLGIDASSTNKLYNNMQEYGVWNFTFEILQKCSRDKLNEKERFWIEMYQSNKVGMNITKGNK